METRPGSLHLSRRGGKLHAPHGADDGCDDGRSGTWQARTRASDGTDRGARSIIGAGLGTATGFVFDRSPLLKAGCQLRSGGCETPVRPARAAVEVQKPTSGIGKRTIYAKICVILGEK